MAQHDHEADSVGWHFAARAPGSGRWVVVPCELSYLWAPGHGRIPFPYP